MSYTMNASNIRADLIRGAELVIEAKINPHTPSLAEDIAFHMPYMMEKKIGLNYMRETIWGHFVSSGLQASCICPGPVKPD